MGHSSFPDVHPAWSILDITLSWTILQVYGDYSCILSGTQWLTGYSQLDGPASTSVVGVAQKRPLSPLQPMTLGETLSLPL